MIFISICCIPQWVCGVRIGRGMGYGLTIKLPSFHSHQAWNDPVISSVWPCSTSFGSWFQALQTFCIIQVQIPTQVTFLGWVKTTKNTFWGCMTFFRALLAHMYFERTHSSPCWADCLAGWIPPCLYLGWWSPINYYECVWNQGIPSKWPYENYRTMSKSTGFGVLNFRTKHDFPSLWVCEWSR